MALPASRPDRNQSIADFLHDCRVRWLLGGPGREPSQIERQLLSGAVQIGIAPFNHHVPNIGYEPLLKEPHRL